MFTFLLGILMVLLSAAGFGYALFGRRPLPQPSMSPSVEPFAGEMAEQRPSRAGAPGPGGSLEGHWIRRLLAREATADHQPVGDLGLSRSVRLRSAALLALTVLGLAALLGAALSILTVGVVFLLG